MPHACQISTPPIPSARRGLRSRRRSCGCRRRGIMRSSTSRCWESRLTAGRRTGRVPGSVAAKHGPVGMVHIDSHQDMWEEYFGNKYFHGTPFRRAIEEKLLDTRRVVQIGIRGPVYAETDFDFGRKHGVRTITAEQVAHEGLAWVKEQI